MSSRYVPPWRCNRALTYFSSVQPADQRGPLPPRPRPPAYPMADLQVRGRSVDAPTAVRPLTLVDYPVRPYYWLQRPSHADELKKWPTLTVRMKRKDEKLQELLTSQVDVKRRKTATADKTPFEPNPYPLPSYKILSDIYKSQSKTLEDMKDSLFGSYAYDKSPDDLFDLSILYPYMSNAYKKLYGQHLDNLKEISKNFKQQTPKSVKSGDKKTITIKGVESQDSEDN